MADCEDRIVPTENTIELPSSPVGNEGTPQRESDNDPNIVDERMASVVDTKPAVEFMTMKNLDTGEVYIIGENDPDFDFHTFELTGEETPTDNAALAADDNNCNAEKASNAPVTPVKSNSGWWERMLNWIYSHRNKDGSSRRVRLNPGGHGHPSGVKPKTPFTKLSSFKFHKELGKGAFGRVLLAEAKIDGKLYALKIISKKDMRSSDKRQAKAERDILLAMSNNHSHPFTTGLKFAFQSAHNLYLGMDYFPGGNLKELIRKKGHLPEDWVRFYSAELILAISHLHSLHVIYRDIKPHNIMIDATGHIILIDYGLSKQAVSDSRGAQSLVGTPDYSAPEVLKTGVYRIEQANKEKERKMNRKAPRPASEDQAADIGYGKAADWWSVGVMMYEMLSGTPAFRGKDLRQTYQRVLFAELVFEPDNRFSDDAKDILRGLLNRDPAARLGAGENPPTDIMSMNFFKGIDWVSIFERRENGPVVPPPVQLGAKTSGKRNSSADYSTGPGNPKLNLRDSIISPGTMLNDPNALQDWSFFDSDALSNATDADKDKDKQLAKNTAANAAISVDSAQSAEPSSDTATTPNQATAMTENEQAAPPVQSLAHMAVTDGAVENKPTVDTQQKSPEPSAESQTEEVPVEDGSV